MKKRILAILIDHIVGTIISLFIFMGFNWESIINPTESNFMRPFETFNTILALGMIYYLLKDTYQGRSVGKRVIGIAVRDFENSSITPGSIRLIIRNITTFLWPIELLLLILMRRRIGDIIARTQVTLDFNR